MSLIKTSKDTRYLFEVVLKHSEYSACLAGNDIDDIGQLVLSLVNIKTQCSDLQGKGCVRRSPDIPITMNANLVKRLLSEKQDLLDRLLPGTWFASLDYFNNFFEALKGEGFKVLYEELFHEKIYYGILLAPDHLMISKGELQ